MFEHFLQAQSDTYAQALAELKRGRKQSHWMWFVFPQIVGLGRSEMALRFSLSGLQDAAMYLSHPILGIRLHEATQAVLLHARHATAHDIFGSPDDLKFRSSMTLFSRAAPELSLFTQALAAFYDGAEDPETIQRL
ncbi:MAG: DUF1810 family protein [Alphaproteobacteria bacterium]|nr:MAG: DUF1810 family protein [Alphaproteobacteria bacterium]